MWIICDTNIWYDVAVEKIILPVEHTYVIPITVVEEFVITPKQDFEHEFVKKAIRTMMKQGEPPNNKIINYVEPFQYFITVDTKGYYAPKTLRVQNFINYTTAFANDEITEKLKQSTKEYRETRKNQYKNFADIINKNGEIIKYRIKDKRTHEYFDTSESNKEMIKGWVKHLTGYELNENFDWGMTELFIYTLGVLFKNIELGKNRMTKNDVIDLLNLIYVSPGQLYWTREKRWINFIKQAGMSKYLYVH